MSWTVCTEQFSHPGRVAGNNSHSTDGSFNLFCCSLHTPPAPPRHPPTETAPQSPGCLQAVQFCGRDFPQPSTPVSSCSVASSGAGGWNISEHLDTSWHLARVLILFHPLTGSRKESKYWGEKEKVGLNPSTLP